MDLSHIINWKLKPGSHEFPGPDGGTCINEAAIVAAGFEYRKVNSHADCPPCFCPVLSSFAIIVNDRMPDAGRPVLMPLVTRLAGSKDEEPWVEEARADYIERHLYREVVYPFMRERRRFSTEFPDRLARIDERLESVLRTPSPVDKVVVLGTVLLDIWAVLERGGTVYFVKPLPISMFDPCAPPDNADAVLEAQVLSPHEVWRQAAVGLTMAFRIGTQAPVADTAKVVERMEAAKVLVKA